MFEIGDDDAAIPEMIGQILKDTYRLERVIGRGGMGVVYEASHTRLSRRFTIKVLIPEMAHSSEAIERFRREAEITSALMTTFVPCPSRSAKVSMLKS